MSCGSSLPITNLFTGDVVLTELRKVLAQRIKLPAATVDDILRCCGPRRSSQSRRNLLTCGCGIRMTAGFWRQPSPGGPMCWSRAIRISWPLLARPPLPIIQLLRVLGFAEQDVITPRRRGKCARRRFVFATPSFAGVKP